MIVGVKVETFELESWVCKFLVGYYSEVLSKIEALRVNHGEDGWKQLWEACYGSGSVKGWF